MIAILMLGLLNRSASVAGNIISQDVTRVVLPRSFNAETMYPFFEAVLNKQRDATCSIVTFDFSRLQFIDPVGVVSLSNMIEYLDKLNVKVRFGFHRIATPATEFLDDAGFFERYVGEKAFRYSRPRNSTMPLQLIADTEMTEFLYFRLIPWIGRSVGESDQSLITLRASLEEIFHNVVDHSGVQVGCTFAQHFPQRSEIQIAVSDFGDGIPDVIRRKAPYASDPETMRLACQEGFTTKSNVHNRGAGLPTLTRYVTKRNGGTVLIAAAGAQLAARPAPAGEMRITSRYARGFYPGTLFRVLLRTDNLKLMAADAEQEDFQW